MQLSRVDWDSIVNTSLMSIITSGTIVASAGKFLIRGSSMGVGLHRYTVAE